MHILMVAAENGALPGGKVGGIGDVIRDLPEALAARGHRVTIITPGYQYFSGFPGAEKLGESTVTFATAGETLGWYAFPSTTRGIDFLILEHPRFAACGAGKIYCHDAANRPFATDATKFALLCLGVAQGLLDGNVPRPDAIHLHDWHAALLVLLCRHHERFAELADLPMVYTIHNLALQGVRPLANDESSLAAWYGDVDFPRDVIVDPRYGDCINPTRAALRLCDRIHAVSPTYAREILEPSDPSRGYYGGEGLEADLREAGNDGRLVGILNGVDYPPVLPPHLPPLHLLDQCAALVRFWREAGDAPVHRAAAKRIDAWRKLGRTGAGMLLTSVGRLTTQKVNLLLQQLEDGQTALDALLDRMDGEGRLVVLGSGDAAVESQLAAIAAKRENFLFLRGYAEAVGDSLYASGDLFLMPSSFEPCGISQMLAMRSGQPCLVHGVGGLRDTVEDNVTGFVFHGEHPVEQARNMLSRFDAAMAMWRDDLESWVEMRVQAASRRFSWAVAAEKMEKLYESR